MTKKQFRQFIAVSLSLVILLASVATIQTVRVREKALDNQTHLEMVKRLRIDVRRLEKEIEFVEEKYNDGQRDLKLALDALKQIDYNEIVDNPGGVDLWLQICVHTLEGK